MTMTVSLTSIGQIYSRRFIFKIIQIANFFLKFDANFKFIQKS